MPTELGLIDGPELTLAGVIDAAVQLPRSGHLQIATSRDISLNRIL